MRRALFACAALVALPAVVQPVGAQRIERVDPLTIADDDFARHRDPALWLGLNVSRIAFQEEAATWRLWRIANTRRPDGPLWVVTHDNENATFAAALTAVRSWGGVAMVVDTGPADTTYAARFNREVADGRPIDPNRNFRDWHPLYAASLLGDLRVRSRPIIALHTNAPGFAPSQSHCGVAGAGGSGEISILLCNDRFHPVPSRARGWPFDDDDTLALTPYLAGRSPRDAWCGTRLADADFNVVFERVAASDGSLSNYAAQHGLRYINLETRERGSSTAGIAAARDRLVIMVDVMMERCGEVPGITLRRPGR